jgi:20S proteasome alpha/beta subunit
MIRQKKQNFFADENKIFKISDSLMIAAVGDSGDTVQFVEYISKNILLYKMRNGYELGPKVSLHFTLSLIKVSLLFISSPS